MSDLRQRAASGVRWNALSMCVTVTIQFVQATVLARLLAPEYFGLVGLAIIVSELAQAIGDLGVSAAIIHRQDVTRDQLSSLYWLNVIMGGALSLMVVGISPLVAWIYNEPRVVPLMPLVAAIFLVTPFGQQFRILLQKELQFRRIAAIDMICAAGGLCTAVGLARAGVGPSAILSGPVSSAVLRTALLGLAGWRQWRPQFRLRRADLRGFVAFGMFQIGERLANTLTQRMDQLLLGTLLGAQTLGYYNFSYNLLATPVMKLNGVLTDVAFPVFARLQHEPEELRRGYMRVLATIMLVVSPLLLGAAAIAPQLVPALFGQKWVPAVPLLQMIAVVVLFRTHANPVGSLVLARGRPELSFRWVLGVSICQTPLILLGVHLGGAVGVCIALIGLQSCLAVANYLVLVRPLLGPCSTDYLRAVVSPVVLALTMALLVASAGRVLAAEGWLSIAGLVAIGAVTYGLLVRLFLPNEIARLRAVLVTSRPLPEKTAS